MLESLQAARQTSPRSMWRPSAGNVELSSAARPPARSALSPLPPPVPTLPHPSAHDGHRLELGSCGWMGARRTAGDVRFTGVVPGIPALHSVLPVTATIVAKPRSDARGDGGGDGSKRGPTPVSRDGAESAASLFFRTRRAAPFPPFSQPRPPTGGSRPSRTPSSIYFRSLGPRSPAQPPARLTAARSPPARPSPRSAPHRLPPRTPSAR